MCIKNFDLQLAAWQRKTEKLWLFLHVSSTPPRCKHVKNSCGRRRNPATSSHSVKGKRNISTAGFTFYYPFKKNKKEKATKEGARQTQQEPWLLSGSDSSSVTIFITTTAPSSLLPPHLLSLSHSAFQPGGHENLSNGTKRVLCDVRRFRCEETQ